MVLWQHLASDGVGMLSLPRDGCSLSTVFISVLYKARACGPLLTNTSARHLSDIGSGRLSRHPVIPHFPPLARSWLLVLCYPQASVDFFVVCDTSRQRSPGAVLTWSPPAKFISGSWNWSRPADVLPLCHYAVLVGLSAWRTSLV